MTQRHLTAQPKRGNNGRAQGRAGERLRLVAGKYRQLAPSTHTTLAGYRVTDPDQAGSDDGNSAD